MSVRYADEIAEMSEFFTTAGIAVEKPQALAQVAQRLREDRGFHRDLTSHVWVMLHRRGSAVRYGEMLGVVALAAAGKQLAAEADENVAHDLLRFVMEAHDRLHPSAKSSVPTSQPGIPEPVVSRQPTPGVVAIPVATDLPATDVVKTPVAPSVARFPPSGSPVRVASEAETLLPIETVEAPSVRPVLDTPIRFSRVDVETADDTRRKSFVWVALAAVLMLAALAGWWFYRNTSAAPEAVATPAPVIEGNAATPAAEAPFVKQPVPETPVVEQPAPSVAPIRPSAAPKNSHSSRTAVSSHRQPAPAPQTHVAHLAAPSAPQQVASVAPPPAAVSRPSAASPAPNTSAPIVRSPASTSKPAAPATVSAGTLSKQLDRPGLTKEQEAEYDSTGRRYPRLLRRTPPNNNDVLMAKANVPPPLGASNTAAGSAPAGIVRPTSLGVMASNLVYSPAATYPPAASAAHVAGAVKVEAVVDTSGNVAAARVISGPVQLRDAALNAVQQWRYKPYVLGGKARTFTTQAMMEFELP
ncbi:TonB family protein [Terriglobus sp. RCC_193]|uniref:energy transducer TonB n=1 Tax=Terriglobus sp. RCC_193 TaxID=3239218 RepID=UPI003526347D